MLKANLLLAAAAVVIGGEAQAAAAQPAPRPMPTKDFVQAAAQSDQYEILAGRVAVVESHDPRIRAFAQDMIQDHTKTSQALEQAAMASGLSPPPPGLSDDGSKFLNQLQSLRGLEFDKAYMTQQVLAHTQALVVEQSYVTGGSDPNIQQVARSAVPIIQHHLEIAGQIDPSSSP